MSWLWSFCFLWWHWSLFKQPGNSVKLKKDERQNGNGNFCIASGELQEKFDTTMLVSDTYSFNFQYRILYCSKNNLFCSFLISPPLLLSLFPWTFSLISSCPLLFSSYSKSSFLCIFLLDYCFLDNMDHVFSFIVQIGVCQIHCHHSCKQGNS